MKAALRLSIGDLLQAAARLHAAGQLASALAAYDQALALSPSNADAWCNRGDVLTDLGRLEPAVASYDRAIALNPAHADAHDFRGIALAQLGRMDLALASFERAVALAPGNVNAIGNRANALQALGRLEEALAGFERATRLRPDFAVAHINCAVLLLKLGRPQEALSRFDRAVALQPGDADAYFGRGMVLARLGRLEDAAASYRRAIELRPGHAEALVQLTETMEALGRPVEAAAYYGRVFAMQHERNATEVRQRLSLDELKRLEEELERYRQAAQRHPHDARPLGDMAARLTDLGRHEESLETSDRALAIDPGLAYVHRNRSAAFEALGLIEAALESYDRAVALDPRFGDIPGRRMAWGLQLCRWDDFDRRTAEIVAAVEAGEEVTTPFNLLLFSGSAALQRKYIETIAARHFSDPPAPPLIGRYPRRERIRIGYFSADFYNHATLHLMAEMLEAHDRDRFELFAFSFGPPAVDAWRKRAVDIFDRFFDIGSTSDLDVINQAREMEIDIGVDLKGYTQRARIGLFPGGVAPIQVNFLGYPGTMGPFYDYLIADRTLVPETTRCFYAENIVFLPGSYQPNCRTREISEKPLSRRDLGLPQDGVVYCCFNQSQKITPAVFESWMNILRQVEHSVLWLWITRKSAADNLKAHAQAHGIDPDRIVFATAMEVEDHLNRLRLADLFLDTLPYNAHTTASDALRMGVPLVTCAGEAFAGRVAASLLNAAGLPELITTRREDYEALAVALGRDPARLAALKDKLRRNVQTGSLFDGADFARKLERAYVAMYERWQAGQPPADIEL